MPEQTFPDRITPAPRVTAPSTIAPTATERTVLEQIDPEQIVPEQVAAEQGLVIPDGSAIYRHFVEIFNARDYDRLDRVLTDDFVDHHPGLVDVTSLAVYRKNLASVIEALEMKAVPHDVVTSGHQVFTRIKLTGRHVGTFLGIEPTGNQVTWYTHEFWRVRDGRFVERWAVDDLFGLVAQLGVELPSWSDPE
jgi:predicted ester cyclase